MTKSVHAESSLLVNLVATGGGMMDEWRVENGEGGRGERRWSEIMIKLKKKKNKLMAIRNEMNLRH